MKRVFICSPFGGESENVDYARQMCKRAIAEGCNPVAPHLFYPQFLDNNNAADRRAGMNRGLDMLKFCTELWICGNRITRGMFEEINAASDMGLRIIAVE